MKNILVMRRGLLGDTIVATAALRCLRQAYPTAKIMLVSELLPKTQTSWAQQVFQNSGLVDSILDFGGYNAASLIKKIKASVGLIYKLRKTNWDLGVALDLPQNVRWERYFLWLVGAKTVVSAKMKALLPRSSDGSLLRVLHVVDQLIAILRPLKISCPEPGQASLDLGITTDEMAQVEAWLSQVHAHHAPRPWIAVSPWTNMPAKQWPVERFSEVIVRLCNAVGGTPFLLGGPSEHESAKALLQEWGSGFSAVGSLNVRQGIGFLSQSDIYIGNDTGTMHMAASAGIRCVVVFSGRDSPGLWEPYGSGHIVLRKPVPCEGCMLRDCTHYAKRCIMEITPDEVFNASLSILNHSSRQD